MGQADPMAWERLQVLSRKQCPPNAVDTYEDRYQNNKSNASNPQRLDEISESTLNFMASTEQKTHLQHRWIISKSKAQSSPSCSIVHIWTWSISRDTYSALWGPTDWQTESILKSLGAMAHRMYSAEVTVGDLQKQLVNIYQLGA